MGSLSYFTLSRNKLEHKKLNYRTSKHFLNDYVVYDQASIHDVENNLLIQQPSWSSHKRKLGLQKPKTISFLAVA
jgi:hypothetical protein